MRRQRRIPASARKTAFSVTICVTTATTISNAVGQGQRIAIRHRDVMRWIAAEIVVIDAMNGRIVANALTDMNDATAVIVTTEATEATEVNATLIATIVAAALDAATDIHHPAITISHDPLVTTTMTATANVTGGIDKYAFLFSILLSTEMYHLIDFQLDLLCNILCTTDT